MRFRQRGGGAEEERGTPVVKVLQVSKDVARRKPRAKAQDPPPAWPDRIPPHHFSRKLHSRRPLRPKVGRKEENAARTSTTAASGLSVSQWKVDTLRSSRINQAQPTSVLWRSGKKTWESEYKRTLHLPPVPWAMNVGRPSQFFRKLFQGLLERVFNKVLCFGFFFFHALGRIQKS